MNLFKRKAKLPVLILAVTLAMALIFSGCTGGGQESEVDEMQANKEKELHLGMVNWSSAIAATNVVKEVLESEMGYENVKVTTLQNGALWSGIATGDVDAEVCAWLPNTDKNFYEKYKDEVDDLGPNLEGAKIGLVVPEYVDIDSVTELNEHKEKFDKKIMGIDPGAGEMVITENLIDEYGLDFDLIEGSGSTMTAALANAIEKDEWVVVTGWSPHWKFIKWDLKYLEEPKNMYGDAERIHTLARQGLKEDMPVAYKFLDNFKWTPEQNAEVMYKIQQGMDDEKAAEEWVENNQDVVQEWIPEEIK